jgi:NAD(P)H-nitrite reductase large subunit
LARPRHAGRLRLGKNYRTCKSCIGTDLCRVGLGDRIALATKIQRRFRGIDSPGKLKLAPRRGGAVRPRARDNTMAVVA